MATSPPDPVADRKYFEDPLVREIASGRTIARPPGPTMAVTEGEAAATSPPKVSTFMFPP